MKKRNLISIVGTIVFAILTNHYWLVFKPMETNFDIKGIGTAQITVFLDKKYNDEDWQKAKSETKKINLYKTNHIQYFVENSRCPKKFKIEITDINNPVKISNITIRNGEYKLNDLNSFKAQKGKLVIENNNLILYPKNSQAVLIYNKKLDIKPLVIFDKLLLIIILVLTYALLYRITSYLADFETLKDQSKIDKVFLFIFFLILIIPSFKIDKSDISGNENRTLAKYKGFIVDERINFNFGKDFENWFNDRFLTRNQLISLNTKINNLFSPNHSENIENIMGSDNWLFYKKESSTENYRNSIVFTDKELQDIAKNLERIQSDVKSKNAKFYLVICPDKDKIYGEYYPEEYIKIRPDSQSRANQLVNYLNKNTSIKTLYLYDALMSYKRQHNDLLYWKNENTHWNELGAFIGYKAIMEMIDKPSLNPDFNVEYSTEGGISDIKALGINPDVYKNVKYKKSNLQNNNCEAKMDKENEAQYNCINPNPLIKNKLYLIHDSFSKDLIPYFSNTFAKFSTNWDSYYTYSNEDAKKVKDFDTVMIILVERRVDALRNKHVEGEQ